MLKYYSTRHHQSYFPASLCYIPTSMCPVSTTGSDTMRLTFMIVPALLLAATCTAMASPPPDTTQPEKPKLNLQFEVRPGWYNGEFTVSLQAGYQWFNFFSTDLFGRTFPVSIHGGVT